MYYLDWLCSVCGTLFSARIQHMYVSTGRCKDHAAKLKHRQREHYTGDVPGSLLRPIRAGLLQNIGTDQLIALIATLEPISSQCAGAADPAGAALAMARGYVESIIAGNFTRVQLLDSVFWGDDTVTRKDGSRYVRPPQPKKKRPNDVDDAGDPENNAAPPAAGAAADSTPAPIRRRRRLIPPSPVVAAPVDHTNDTTDAAGAHPSPRAGGGGDHPPADAPPAGLLAPAGDDGLVSFTLPPIAACNTTAPPMVAAAGLAPPPPVGYTADNDQADGDAMVGGHMPTAPPPPADVPVAPTDAQPPSDPACAADNPPLALQTRAGSRTVDVVTGGVVDTEDRCTERPDYWEGILRYLLSTKRDLYRIWIEDIIPVLGIDWPFRIGVPVVDKDRQLKRCAVMRAVATAMNRIMAEKAVLPDPKLQRLLSQNMLDIAKRHSPYSEAPHFRSLFQLYEMIEAHFRSTPPQPPAAAADKATAAPPLPMGGGVGARTYPQSYGRAKGWAPPAACNATATAPRPPMSGGGFRMHPPSYGRAAGWVPPMAYKAATAAPRPTPMGGGAGGHPSTYGRAAVPLEAMSPIAPVLVQTPDTAVGPPEAAGALPSGNAALPHVVEEAAQIGPLFEFKMPCVDGVPMMQLPVDTKKSICRSYLEAIKTDMPGHWKEIAEKFLSVPCPIGDHRLSPQHLDYCRDILTMFFRQVLPLRPMYDEDKYLRLQQLLSQSKNNLSSVTDILRWIESGMTV